MGVQAKAAGSAVKVTEVLMQKLLPAPDTLIGSLLSTFSKLAIMLLAASFTLAYAGFVAGYALGVLFGLGLRIALMCGLVCAYLPSYLDNSELVGCAPLLCAPWQKMWQPRTWPEFQTLPIWRYTFGPRGVLFPSRLVFADGAAAELKNQEKQFIIAAFPHGVLALQHILLMTDAVWDYEKSGHAHLLTERLDLAASILFRIPFLREICLWLGCVDAGKGTARATLASGRHMYVLPGGQAEQLMTARGEEKVYVRERKGFVKLGLERQLYLRRQQQQQQPQQQAQERGEGVALVPVYCYGEVDATSTLAWCLGARRWLCKVLGVALPLAYMVHRVPLTLVVGKPLALEAFLGPKAGVDAGAGDVPSKAQIERAHAAFVVALQELHERHQHEHLDHLQQQQAAVGSEKSKKKDGSMPKAQGRKLIIN